MGLLYCCDCGKYFEEEELVSETVWSHSNYIGFGGWYPETTDRCPYCGGEDIEDAYECEICGEPTLIEVCDKCKNEVYTALEKFFDDFAKKHRCDAEKVEEVAVRYLEQ